MGSSELQSSQKEGRIAQSAKLTELKPSSFLLSRQWTRLCMSKQAKGKMWGQGLAAAGLAALGKVGKMWSGQVNGEAQVAKPRCAPIMLKMLKTPTKARTKTL